jgi:hypothetical protein
MEFPDSFKRVTGTYRYYLTRAGRAAIAAGRRLTESSALWLRRLL